MKGLLLLAPVFRKISVFFEMIKFEHTLFALPFAYLGLVLGAGGWPRAYDFGWVTAAMVSFRTMGMALNRVIDRKIDAHNPRTRARALPSGLLSPGFVWVTAVISWAVFEAAAWMLGEECFRLSPFPVFLAVLYPFAKRFTWFSHFILGMILGIAPYGAWLAAGAGFSWVPGWILIGVAAWVAGFDIIYALQDIDFDRSSGLHSFPAKFGKETSLQVTRCLHVLTLIAWLLAGQAAGLGWIYFSGMGLVAGFLLREHWLIRSFGLEKMSEAFFAMNAFVSISVFIAVVADMAGRS